MSPLTFCCSAIELMTFNLAFGTETKPSWIVIFRNVSKLRVTMLAVTFLFWLESQNSNIHQYLNLILEDITSAGRVMHHPMKEAVVRIICKPHSLGHRASSNLSLLPLCSKWKIVTTCSFLKEYTFGRNLDSWLHWCYFSAMVELSLIAQ